MFHLTVASVKKKQKLKKTPVQSMDNGGGGKQEVEKQKKEKARWEDTQD